MVDVSNWKSLLESKRPIPFFCKSRQLGNLPFPKPYSGSAHNFHPLCLSAFPLLFSPDTHPCINELTLAVNHTWVTQSVIKQGRVSTHISQKGRVDETTDQNWDRPRWLPRRRRSPKLRRRRRSIIWRTTWACARSTLWSLTSKAWGILWLQQKGLFIWLCPPVWSLLRRWRRRWRKFRESSAGTDGYGSHLSHLDNKGGVSMQVPGWRRIGMTKQLKRKTGGGKIEFQMAIFFTQIVRQGTAAESVATCCQCGRRRREHQVSRKFLFSQFSRWITSDSVG